MHPGGRHAHQRAARCENTSGSRTGSWSARARRSQIRRAISGLSSNAATCSAPRGGATVILTTEGLLLVQTPDVGGLQSAVMASARLRSAAQRRLSSFAVAMRMSTGVSSQLPCRWDKYRRSMRRTEDALDLLVGPQGGCAGRRVGRGSRGPIRQGSALAFSGRGRSSSGSDAWPI